MKIVFCNQSILVGGIEKAIELLAEYLYKDNELEVVYKNRKTLDMNIANILSRYAKVYNIDDTEKIECDVFVYCNSYSNFEEISKKVVAKKYISWIHSKPYELEDSLLENEEFIKQIDTFVCVSEEVKNELKFNHKDIRVIHNFLNENILELASEEKINLNPNILNLVVVSRLSKGKGFNRLYKLLQTLDNNGIEYNVKVVGNGRSTQQSIFDMFEKNKRVEFLGYKQNPYPYIKQADYLVQLSDYETWCTSITESKMLGTPCIVTNFSAAKEQIINDENGIIIDLNETDYSKYINQIIDGKEKYREKLKEFKYENEIEKWNEIFDK